MRVTQHEMDAHHAKIVESASRLFRERGLRGTSVADAMNEAGMTHGGFYRHFASKDELVVAAMRSAFDAFAEPLKLRSQSESPKLAAKDYKAVYLSAEHVEHPGLGCPLPALGGNLARESGDVRAAFSAGLERMIAALASAHEGSSAKRRATAMREMAMLVGAVYLARACGGELASEMLAACRD